MLQAAHLEKNKKVDVVIGYVETHGRPETEQLVEGLEIIPPYQIVYRETQFREVDIDAIIARKPHVVLIDELAHTNAPGSRHAKRYQDVQELINNGIDVYATLNVQHIESRTDTVTQITGVTIRETVPDDVLEAADEVELVDLTADELLQRLADGKVYTPERSQEAVRNFFRKGNVTALREMSLRLVADRVDKQLREYMYQVSADINDVEYRKVRLNADYSLDAQRLLDAIDAHTKVIFLCSPNNPTANLLNREEMLKIVEGFAGITVIDEAYIDFSSEPSWLKMLDRYPRLIVLQTFSKA